MGVLVGSDGEVPDELGLDREALAAAGFTGAMRAARCLSRPATGHLLVAVGVRALADWTSTQCAMPRPR